MDTTPVAFMNMTQGEIRKLYRDLSRKYHPDKNAEDTTEKFMKLKEAFEVLGDKDKKLAYDIYNQVDFSADEKMMDALMITHKNKTERDKQFEAYKAGRAGMKVFGDVGPYYITWLLLTSFRVERENSFNIFLGLIAVVTGFEVLVRKNYGNENFQFLIDLMYRYFPESFTVGQNMKLTRNLFPLLFQFVLIVCDHTIDAEAELDEEELKEKQQAETYLNDI